MGNQQLGRQAALGNLLARQELARALQHVGGGARRLAQLRRAHPPLSAFRLAGRLAVLERGALLGLAVGLGLLHGQDHGVARDHGRDGHPRGAEQGEDVEGILVGEHGHDPADRSDPQERDDQAHHRVELAALLVRQDLAPGSDADGERGLLDDAPEEIDLRTRVDQRCDPDQRDHQGQDVQRQGVGVADLLQETGDLLLLAMAVQDAQVEQPAGEQDQRLGGHAHGVPAARNQPGQECRDRQDQRGLAQNQGRLLQLARSRRRPLRRHLGGLLRQLLHHLFPQLFQGGRIVLMELLLEGFEIFQVVRFLAHL